MLYDCMQVFMEKARKTQSESFRQDTDTDMEIINKFTIDHYVPKPGTYILLNLDKDFALEYKLDISVDKSGEIIGQTDSHYQYIRYLDYNSKLIKMNKPMDSKKVIHSNNLYSFFIKKENITGKKLTIDIIDGYYNTLANPEIKYNKPKTKELYRQTGNKLGSVNQEILERIREWVKGWAKDTSILPIEISGKEYLKIFFVYQDERKTKELYEKENERYVIPNIYNDNEYNKKVADEILGLPNNNMVLNTDKPFLENRTRKTTIPLLVNMENVIWQNRFFDYLYGQASVGNVNIYFDFDEKEIYAFPDKSNPPYIESGMYLRIRKGKEVEILDCDTVLSLNPNMQPTFYYKSILEGKDESLSGGGCDTRSQLAAIIDEVFFKKKLACNFFTEPESLSITDSVVQNVLLTYRGRLFEWLYCNPKCDIKEIIAAISEKLIKNAIQKGDTNKARQQFNLALSLQDYLNHDTRMEEMMRMVQEEFKKHMSMYKDEWNFECDEEYYYAVGQLVDYFLSLSKSAKKSLSLANPFLTAKEDTLIKEKLSQMFEKYSYAMDNTVVDVRAKNIINHVMLYMPGKKVQQQYLIAGLTANNAFYMKKENQEGK